MDNQTINQSNENLPVGEGETEKTATEKVMVEKTAGSSMPAFAGAFDDDSSRPAINTGCKPVEQEYTPPMYGQPFGSPTEEQYIYQPIERRYVPPVCAQPLGTPTVQYVSPVYAQPAGQYMPPVYGQPTGVPTGQYIPPMYGQPTGVPTGQYIPPMYGQPTGVPTGQYIPPMYGQPISVPAGQYVPPMYGQPFGTPTGQYYQPVVQAPALPKPVMDRRLFRKHCSRVGFMLLADFGLMFGVEVVVLVVAMIALVVMGVMSASDMSDTSSIAQTLISPVMFAGGLSAIVGNMLPSSLHLRKWRYKFTDPFKGDKLGPLFTLAALFTALGLNSAWCQAYYYLQGWFGDFMGFTPKNTNTLYTHETMPLVGMIFYLVWVCVIAPVTEEYMFRGAMLKTLSKYGSGFAVVASAVAFGLMHGNMGQTPMAFLIGLIMGYVAAKSGNIRQTIFIHMVNNILASLPQIISYFLPGWMPGYEKYIGYFDVGTMIFAGLALLYFIYRRARGLSSRKKRLAAGAENTKYAERAWLRLEVPDSRRLPQLDSVRHKFCHFVTSAGMLIFILVCLLSIFIVSFLPYIIRQDLPGMGI